MPNALLQKKRTNSLFEDETHHKLHSNVKFFNLQTYSGI